MDGIGERLKEERLRNGWSQKDLARESKINVDTISGIETGQHEPRPSTLRKLAKALSIEVRDLFEEPVPLGEAPREAGPADEARIEQPSLGIGLQWAPDTEYEAAVAAVKKMYRQQRQQIVEFGDLPSDEERREILKNVITACNMLNAVGVSWERTEGLLLRELMVNAGLHMLAYYEGVPAVSPIANLEEERARLRAVS